MLDLRRGKPRLRGCSKSWRGEMKNWQLSRPRWWEKVQNNVFLLRDQLHTNKIRLRRWLLKLQKLPALLKNLEVDSGSRAEPQNTTHFYAQAKQKGGRLKWQNYRKLLSTKRARWG